mmetsp:Transcript_40767/g.96518  ORF Transcript_40767/g.96518 Transcript_40767/m.96518 type:complete len:619 (+) Transcript_40767:129-1985(+)
MAGTGDGVRRRLLWISICGLLHASSGEIDFLTPHCGKKFRIATHQAPPFIFVDPAKCRKQKCPPEAFGTTDRPGDGGLTYRFLNDDLLPILKQYCANANKTDVQFEWYLPPSGRNLAANAVKMACNDNFEDISPLTLEANATGAAMCGSATSYMGASDTLTCSYVNDASCVSKGPDMVAGAVHIMRERLDMIDFSMPYLTVRQVVVKQNSLRLPEIMKTFDAFDGTLWVVIMVEIAIVWFCILAVETWVNPQIEKSSPFDPFYDSFYWAFGSALDPGGPGKAACSAGGKIFMMGHWIFMVIMAASYTGSVGPFLAADNTANTLSDLNSLATGPFSVVVRGPKWNISAGEFLGTPKGGNAEFNTSRSTQFKYLQNLMGQDSTNKFKIWTTKRMETYRNGVPWEREEGVDPCTLKDLDPTVEMGAFDLVACSGTEGAELTPDALIFDEQSVYYEMNTRFEKASSKTSCDLKVVGESFSPSNFGFGFPKGSPYTIPFSKAINQLIQRGELRKYEDIYNMRSSDLPFMCQSNLGLGGEIYVDMVAGVFIFTLAGTLVALVWGVPERMFYFANEDSGDGEEEEVENTLEDADAPEPPEKASTTVMGMCDAADRIEASLKKMSR